MTLHHRTTGFVFRKENILEIDRTFSIFTKDFGRIEVFAKAIRKINAKLKSNIEIFYISDIEFVQGKNKKTLIEAVLKEKFKNIEQIPEKLESAYKIANVLNSFVRGEEKDEQLWNFIIDIFQKLNTIELTTNNRELLYYYFIWNFISILGYTPELSICTVCREKLNPYTLYFSNKEGGIICKKCAVAKRDGIKITSDILKVLRLIIHKEWGILSKLKMEISSKKLLKEISDNYYLYLLHSYAFRATHHDLR